MKYLCILLALILIGGLVTDAGINLVRAMRQAKLVHTEQELRESLGAVPRAAYLPNAFIPPRLPPADDLSTAGLQAFAHEGIRAHGPIRRDCHKTRHGFPQTPAVFPERRVMLANAHDPTIIFEMAGEPYAVEPPAIDTPDELTPQYSDVHYFYGAPGADRTPVQVPEPSPAWLLLGGLGIMAGLGWAGVERRK